jgi:hypothetical protein
LVLAGTGHSQNQGERKLWLNLLEGSFKLIYQDKGSPGEIQTIIHKG